MWNRYLSASANLKDLGQLGPAGSRRTGTGIENDSPVSRVSKVPTNSAGTGVQAPVTPVQSVYLGRTGHLAFLCRELLTEVYL